MMTTLVADRKIQLNPGFRLKNLLVSPDSRTKFQSGIVKPACRAPSRHCCFEPSRASVTFPVSTMTPLLLHAKYNIFCFKPQVRCRSRRSCTTSSTWKPCASLKEGKLRLVSMEKRGGTMARPSRKISRTSPTERNQCVGCPSPSRWAVKAARGSGAGGQNCPTRRSKC